MHICACVNVKDGFREREREKEKRIMRECVHVCVRACGVRACMCAYVCTEDGGAGRKRGGDSVCEKEKEKHAAYTKLSN